MKAWREGLQLRLDGLEARERVVLGAGLAIVLLCACFLLLESAWQERQTLLTGRDILRTELAWMEQQAQLLASMEKHCAPSQVGEETVPARLRSLAARYGIDTLQLRDTGSGRYNLQLRAREGNALLAFVHESVCMGFELSSLDLRDAAAPAEAEQASGQAAEEMPVTARLELVYAD